MFSERFLYAALSFPNHAPMRAVRESGITNSNPVLFHSMETQYTAQELAERVRASKLPPPEERARIRRKSRATLGDFAKVLQVSPMTVARWERGEIEPRLDHAVAYARLLGEIHAATRTEEPAA